MPGNRRLAGDSQFLAARGHRNRLAVQYLGQHLPLVKRRLSGEQFVNGRTQGIDIIQMTRPARP